MVWITFFYFRNFTSLVDHKFSSILSFSQNYNCLQPPYTKHICIVNTNPPERDLQINNLYNTTILVKPPTFSTPLSSSLIEKAQAIIQLTCLFRVVISPHVHHHLIEPWAIWVGETKFFTIDPFHPPYPPPSPTQNRPKKGSMHGQKLLRSSFIILSSPSLNTSCCFQVMVMG